MPYAPGVENHAGEYIMRGAEIAARGLAGGIKDMRERHQESDYLDGVGSFYFKDDPEKYAKFREGSIGSKRGMVTAQQAQQAQQLQQQQQNMHDWAQTDASARGWYGLTQKEEPWAPDDATQQRANDNGYQWLPQTPRSGTFVPMKSKAAAPPMGSDPTGTGQFYFDGSRLKPVPTTALPPDVRTGVETVQSRMDALDKQIRDKQTEISNGNERSGPDWLHLGKSYEEEIADLTRQRGDLQKKMDTIRSTAARTPAVTMPTAPAAAAPGAGKPAGASNFTPGAVYKNPKGEKARYNPDGTWTPLSDVTPGSATGGLDDSTVDYIKKFEGFNPRAYADGAQTSVGYGTRAKAPNETLTEPQAAARLADELNQHASRIDHAATATGVKLTAPQRTALISFDYNTGRGVDAIHGSKGDPHAIAHAIAQGPVTQAGKVLPGLQKRRAAEASLFLGSL